MPSRTHGKRKTGAEDDIAVPRSVDVASGVERDIEYCRRLASRAADDLPTLEEIHRWQHCAFQELGDGDRQSDGPMRASE